MNAINEFDLEPGTYQHYKGGIYVVVNLVTHMDNVETGKMEPLEDPLVVYRDLNGIPRHVNGHMMIPHQVYARKMSEFKGMASNGQKRFTKL